MKWRKITAMVLVLLTVSSLLLLTGCKQTAPDNNENVSGEEDTSQVKNEKDYYTADDYLADPTLFVPVWADEWDVPEEMLDFEEKWESYFTPNGRLMSLVHRADNDVYYPENSLEGIMSCIAAGADMIEIDILLTKDNVIVLSHDATLTRTTNLKQLRDAGVAGLPESDYICDWTLEQLRRLRLVLEREDGNQVTNYVIPTLEDVIKVCKDRIFIYLDTDATSYEFDWEIDFYPLIQKYEAYRTVWMPLTYASSYATDYFDKLVTTIEKDSGYRAGFQIYTSEENIEGVIKMINEKNYPKMLRTGNYGPSSYELVKNYVGQYRIHTNAIYDPYKNLESWKMMHEQGFNCIHVDDYLTMGKYIEELYFQ